MMYIIEPRWIASCPAIETQMAGWNSDVMGRTGDKRCTGRAYEKASEATIRSKPVATS